jgi:hypothetical protein
LLFVLIVNSDVYTNTFAVPDDGRLERWIIRCKNSLQRVKTAIDMYYTVKTMIPDLMAGWDTTTKWFHAINKIM